MINIFLRVFKSCFLILTIFVSNCTSQTAGHSSFDDYSLLQTSPQPFVYWSMKRDINKSGTLAYETPIVQQKKESNKFQTQNITGDSCESALAKEVTDFANTEAFLNAKSKIINAARDGNEHGISFGRDSNQNITLSKMRTGNKHSGSLERPEGLYADIHNHQDYKPPSPGDIYTFIDRTINNEGYATRYVITANGMLYALAVTDKQAIINFNKNYPRIPALVVDNIMYEPWFPEKIMDEMRRMRQLGGATLEMTIAYILEKYNTGIVLMKKDSDGNFKKLKTFETDGEYGLKKYVAANCL